MAIQMPKHGETGWPAAHGHEDETHNLPTLASAASPWATIPPAHSTPATWPCCRFATHQTLSGMFCTPPFTRTHCSHDQLDSHLLLTSQC